MLSLSLTYQPCGNTLSFATFGGKKKGEKMCSTGGAISCFLNIQSNPPGLSLCPLFSTKASWISKDIPQERVTTIPQ